jgi:hypothetical protein
MGTTSDGGNDHVTQVRKPRSMKTAVYIVASAYGCSQHLSSEDAKESHLAAARAANEQIQLAIAESGCSGTQGPQGLCAHLKQAQVDIDNTIYRIDGSQE